MTNRLLTDDNLAEQQQARDARRPIGVPRSALLAVIQLAARELDRAEREM
jgi:hypothetical protein